MDRDRFCCVREHSSYAVSGKGAREDPQRLKESVGGSFVGNLSS